MGGRERTVPREEVQDTVWKLIRTGIKPTNGNVKAALDRRGGTDSIAGDLRAMDAPGLWKRMKPTSVKQVPRAPKARSGTGAALPPPAKATSRSKKSLLADIAHLKDTVARLERELAKARTIADHQAPIRDPSKPNSDQIPFQGMSISDAAIHLLEEHGQPMATWRIAYALEAQGFKFVKEPSRAINNALYKRATKKQDVIRVGHSTWGLSSRDKPSTIRTNISYSSKTDKDYQVERIRLSHQNARERGMSVGRPAFEKTHPFSVILEYRRLRRSGAGIYKALDACGITRSSYSKYRSAIEEAASDSEFCEMARRIRQDAHSS